MPKGGHMKTARDIARSKMSSASVESLLEVMGSYDHKEQRRWVGQNPSLTAWAMKSDTTFDGESKDPD
jgi:hypothetical protein